MSSSLEEGKWVVIGIAVCFCRNRRASPVDDSFSLLRSILGQCQWFVTFGPKLHFKNTPLDLWSSELIKYFSNVFTNSKHFYFKRSRTSEINCGVFSEHGFRYLRYPYQHNVGESLFTNNYFVLTFKHSWLYFKIMSEQVLFFVRRHDVITRQHSQATFKVTNLLDG